MSRTEFDAFVKRQTAEANEQKFDAKQQLREWLEYLDDLHNQIRGFLKEYVDGGTASITTRPIELNEEFIGAYNAPELTVAIGSAKVIFKPVGTLLIGSKGRVDVRGPHGNARLTLMNKKVTNARQLITVTVSVQGDPPKEKKAVEPIEWAWKIISPPPQMTFSELTQDSFFDMILALTNG